MRIDQAQVRIMYYWAKIVKKIHGKAIINSRIHKTSKVEAGSELVNAIFDKHSFCGYDCSIANCDIGAFCSIANRVVIGGGKHPMEWVSMSPVFYEGRDSVKAKLAAHKREDIKRATIGNDVWIGENALIKQGITIGSGAVVGMGSVVTKDIDDYAIVAGCPAKVIRKRFDDDTIRKLLRVRWWEFNDEMLCKYAPYFTDPVKFIEKLEER
jgi:chloramphenicol O-acetyltransferase type B